MHKVILLHVCIFIKKIRNDYMHVRAVFETNQLRVVETIWRNCDMWYAASWQNCAFGATLSETLRESDRVFFGMRDEGVQKRLLTEADLTFAKVLEIAEIADAQNSCRVSQNRNKTEVHQVAAPYACTKKGETVRPRGLQQVWRSA